MQIKTIRKNIENKLNAWLGTIKDEELVKDLKKNILVSGGSIVSMLLNEEVNDYDVYINDMDVLKRLAIFYVKPFGGTILDGRQKDKLLEQYTKETGHDATTVDSEYDDCARAVSLRTLKPDQIKLFFEHKQSGLKVNDQVKAEDWNYTPLFFSPNAISLSDKIQIVLRFHGDNEAIHKTYDFIHATNYFTFKDGVVTNVAALESILTKQLKYQGSLYPVTSIIRAKKFIKRGWNISAGELLKIMFQISELDLKNPDVLEEQLIGVDVAYFGTLIEILRVQKDKDADFKLSSGYLATLIDRIFNDQEEAI